MAVPAQQQWKNARQAKEDVASVVKQTANELLEPEAKTHSKTTATTTTTTK